MSDAAFPRVLIISEEVPQSIHAGGILLRRLFLGYPADAALVISDVPEEGAELLPCRYETIGCRIRRLESTRFARIPRTLDALGMHRVSDRAIDRLATAFKPDAVVSLMQSLSFYGAAYRYARKRNVPLLLIVHDLPEEFEDVYSLARPAQHRMNARIYSSARKRLCVSPQMRDFLRSSYGASGDVLYPSPSDNISSRPLEMNLHLRNGKSLTIGYAGSLAYGYGPQLTAMLPTFEKAGATLNVYSRIALLSKSPALQIQGYAPAEVTWRRIQQECDVVILPYRFNNSSDDLLYRTHFPSKLTEYLRLGLPVLIVGPSHATGVQWGLANPEAALVVTDDSPESFATALSTLHYHSDLRLRIATAALSAGERDFDPARIRSAFLQAIRTSVRQTSIE